MKRKQIFVCLLTLALVICMMPTAIFAEVLDIGLVVVPYGVDVESKIPNSFKVADSGSVTLIDLPYSEENEWGYEAAITLQGGIYDKAFPGTAADAAAAANDASDIGQDGNVTLVFTNAPGLEGKKQIDEEGNATASFHVKETLDYKESGKWVERTFNFAPESYNITITGDELTPHSMDYFEAVAATCENNGNIAYYKCKNCGKLFSDAAGTKELTANNVITMAIGHKWSEWSTVTAPTANTAGLKKRTCKNNAAHVETQTIPATGQTEPKKDTQTESNKETQPAQPPAKIDITKATFEYMTSYPYTGEAITPVKVIYDGKTLIEGKDYEIKYEKNTKVGKAKATVKGIGDNYEGEKILTFKISKAKNPMTLSPSQKKYKASDLKKKAKSFKITVKNAQGKVTYKAANKKSKKALKVTKKGKVTVKKGTKKGTYIVKINAKGNVSYKSITKTVKIIVKK